MNLKIKQHTTNAQSISSFQFLPIPAVKTLKLYLSDYINKQIEK